MSVAKTELEIVTSRIYVAQSVQTTRLQVIGQTVVFAGGFVSAPQEVIAVHCVSKDRVAACWQNLTGSWWKSSQRIDRP